MIKIYDTKAREKRPFVPVADGKVNMYVCGPTVYNYIHIGNARTFISFDTIRRYLTWRGYEVKFVQNITDVDDKIIKKANEEGRSASEVAAEYAQAFIDDMRAAGVMDPDVRPRATEEIDEMIALVEKLIEDGHAYEVEGDVYFAVRSYEGYGQLSGRNVDEMESGHRELRADGQGLEDRKRDPLDFALWKAAKPGEPSWDSPWAKAVPAGISSARLCRRSTWASRSISTVVAQTWRSLITKTSVLSQKLLLVAHSPTTGCMAACFRSTTKRCPSHWATSCCCAMCLRLPMPVCFAC